MPENPETFDAGQSTYSVTLPSFEGPLDLLLHLCQKHELDILDIPISFVTSKYLEYLAVMQLMNLDVASEYLLMAATLAHIKSKMLLPAPPPGQEDDALEEEEDPREALIRRLLEYQKYKQAAADLSARGVAGRDIFTRGVAIDEAVHSGLAPLADVPLYSLVEAFQAVLSKTKVKLTHDIVADRISITDRIHELATMLAERKRVTFESLFTGISTKFDLVITFLALLEMSKLRMTRLFQTEPLAPIYVELTMGPEAGSQEDKTFEHDDMNAPKGAPAEPWREAATSANDAEIEGDRDTLDQANAIEEEAREPEEEREPEAKLEEEREPEAKLEEEREPEAKLEEEREPEAEHGVKDEETAEAAQGVDPGEDARSLEHAEAPLASGDERRDDDEGTT